MILNETFNSTSFVIGFLPALFVGIIATLAVCFVIYKKKMNSFDKMKEDAKIEAQKILKKADIDGRDLANQYKKLFTLLVSKFSKPLTSLRLEKT